MDCTQDWFFVDLPILDDTPTESVGDLLLFAAELVGNDRLRPGHLAISAGVPNSRLWQCKTPLIVLWNHMHIASLKLTGEVTAFASLNSADHTSELGKPADATKEEGEYFAMAAIHSLPEWVISDEPKELREKYATGPCRLPHEELKEVLSDEPNKVTCGITQTSKRKNNRSTKTSSAASSASTQNTVDLQRATLKPTSSQ